MEHNHNKLGLPKNNKLHSPHQQTLYILIKVGNKKKEADFPDALIVNKARFLSEEKGEPFDGVYTFDLAAQQIPGVERP